MPNETEKLLLTVAEAAERASVCRTVAYDLTSRGVWPVVRIGRSIRIPVAGLLKWIEENTSQVAAA
jgi:excisionase family DNA binding protein